MIKPSKIPLGMYPILWPNYGPNHLDLVVVIAIGLNQNSTATHYLILTKLHGIFCSHWLQGPDD
jgi:hypothetical protein